MSIDRSSSSKILYKNIELTSVRKKKGRHIRGIPKNSSYGGSLPSNQDKSSLSLSPSPSSISIPNAVTTLPPEGSLSVDSAVESRKLPVMPLEAQPDRPLLHAKEMPSVIDTQDADVKMEKNSPSNDNPKIELNANVNKNRVNKIQRALSNKAKKIKKVLIKNKNLSEFNINKNEFLERKGVSYRINKRVNKELNRYSQQQILLKLNQFTEFDDLGLQKSNLSKEKSDLLIEKLEGKKKLSHEKLKNFLVKLKVENPAQYARLHVDNNLRLLVCEGNERALGEDVCLQKSSKILAELQELKNKYSTNLGQEYLNKLGELGAKIRDNPELWGTRILQPGLEVSQEIQRVIKHMLRNNIVIDRSNLPLKMSITRKDLAHAKRTRGRIKANVLNAKLKMKDMLSDKIRENLDKPNVKASKTYPNLTIFNMKDTVGQTALDYYLISSELTEENLQLRSIKFDAATIKRREEAFRTEISNIEDAITKGNANPEMLQKQMEALISSFDEFNKSHPLAINQKLGNLYVEKQLLKKNESFKTPLGRSWDQLDNFSFWEIELDKRSVRGETVIQTGFLESPVYSTNRNESDLAALTADPRKDIYEKLQALKRKAYENKLYIPPIPFIKKNNLGSEVI